MPSSTWTNLPEAKRKRITDVAMAEFGSKGFSAGSLNVIARQAGIAKGSLFQYFEHKLDLFATVCEAGSERIERAVVGPVDVDQPFFVVLREIVSRWLDYFATHPLERAMSFATANEVDPEARAAVRGVANAHYAKQLGPLVERAALRGEIRADVSADVVVSATTLLLRHLNSAPFDPVGDPVIPFADMDDASVLEVAMAYVDLLEAAVGTPASRDG